MSKGYKTIEIDGQFYSAKFIGRGQYSKVYQVGDRVVYYTKGDCAKEVVGLWGHYSGSKHLPELIRYHNIVLQSGNVWYVFSAPFYRNVSKRTASAWLIRRAIIQSWRVYNVYRGYVKRQDSYDYMQGFVDMLINQYSGQEMPRSIIHALQEIVNVARNCGGTGGFDFHNNNFGVNEYGILIFRDIFWVRQ